MRIFVNNYTVHTTSVTVTTTNRHGLVWHTEKDNREELIFE